MKEDKKMLIDTNIIAYAFDKSEIVKQPIAKTILEEGFKKKRNLVFALQNLSEFYSVSTNFSTKPLNKELAKKIVRKISAFNHFKIFTQTKNTLLSAIDINIKYNLHFWDSFIAAIMRENNVNTILTEDEDFKKIP